MIFLTNEIIGDTNKLNALIETEQKFIDYNLKTQKTLKEILLNYVQKFANSTNYVDCIGVNNAIKLLEDMRSSLILCNQNISTLENISKELNSITNISELIDKFNGIYADFKLSLMKNTLQIEECLHSISSIYDVKLSQSIEKPTHPSEHTTQKYVENTLLISEMSGKVILPYTIASLQETLQKSNNKYSNIDEIINKDYTLSIDLFKTTSISRFREAFKLMRNKEKSSIKDAFDLGMELLFNYNLHPAIITACKNLDELDIYLAYLETGETDKFDCFKIVFEFAPKIVKTKKLL